MRGVIESFDSATGLGTIRGKDGTLYPFASTDLVRRSKPPHASGRVVFLLKDGKTLVYVRIDRGQQAGLYTIGTDGSKPQPLLKTGDRFWWLQAPRV